MRVRPSSASDVTSHWDLVAFPAGAAANVAAVAAVHPAALATNAAAILCLCAAIPKRRGHRWFGLAYLLPSLTVLRVEQGDRHALQTNRAIAMTHRGKFWRGSRTAAIAGLKRVRQTSDFS
jgi:hypothetical protein